MVNHINMDSLRSLMPGFRKYLTTPEAAQEQEERKAKDEFLATHFSEERIGELDEGILRELIHRLWAFNAWTNKDYLLEEMLRSGLPTIRQAFKQLFYGQEDIAKRFDYVKNHVRVMGAAGISEMLSHLDHKKYPIWNTRSRRGLIALGLEEKQLPRSSQISGAQYASFCELMRNVRAQVTAAFPEFDDFVQLDRLLYFASLQHKALAPSQAPAEEVQFDHDAVVDRIVELGDGLGFEVQKEVRIAAGCRIDAIWRSRVANLGTIAYAFEVHKGGSRDSAILNLQKVKRDPTIQKVVIVSSEKELEVFRREIAPLDEAFRRSVSYFEVGDLQRALDHLQELKDILRTLGLLSA
jgi:hypothetical protein